MQAKMQTQLDAMNAKLDKFIQEHAAPAAPAAKGNSMSPKVRSPLQSSSCKGQLLISLLCRR
jgi:hypothetical protein